MSKKNKKKQVKQVKKMSVEKAINKAGKYCDMKVKYIISNQKYIYSDLVSGMDIEDILNAILSDWVIKGLISDKIINYVYEEAYKKILIAVGNMNEILFGSNKEFLIDLFSECDCADCVGHFIISAVMDLFEDELPGKSEKYNQELMAITVLVEILLMLSNGFMVNEEGLTPVHQVWRLLEWFYA